MLKGKDIFQEAYAVDDIDVAIANWIRIAQIGPFFVTRNTVSEVIWRGHPTKIHMDVAFCQAGPITVELMQPKGPTKDLYPDLGYHHQTFWADDFDAEFSRFAAMGLEVMCQGQSGSVRFAYIDTVHHLGCVTAMVERDPQFAGFLQKIADASTNWDGSDPVRSL